MNKNKCEYCKDPIYKFQKKITKYTPRRGKTEYHKGCHEILLAELKNKRTVKKPPFPPDSFTEEEAKAAVKKGNKWT